VNWYLFAGYAVFWTLIFAYVVYLHRKQSELTKELERLRDSLGD